MPHALLEGGPVTERGKPGTGRSFSMFLEIPSRQRAEEKKEHFADGRIVVVNYVKMRTKRRLGQVTSRVPPSFGNGV